MRSPPPEGQGAAETTCDELTITPIPRPPVLLWGMRERNENEVEPRKKGGSPSSVCFVHDSNW